MIKEGGKLKLEEEKRNLAQNDLKRYLFYFERFTNHKNGYDKALTLKEQLDDIIQQISN